MTHCNRPALTKTRRHGDTLAGLCGKCRSLAQKTAIRHGLAWPPPGRILRLVSRRRYQRGERLNGAEKANGT